MVSVVLSGASLLLTSWICRLVSMGDRYCASNRLTLKPNVFEVEAVFVISTDSNSRVASLPAPPPVISFISLAFVCDANILHHLANSYFAKYPKSKILQLFIVIHYFSLYFSHKMFENLIVKYIGKQDAGITKTNTARLVLLLDVTGISIHLFDLIALLSR